MNTKSMIEVLNVISGSWNSFSDETKKDIANELANTKDTKEVEKVVSDNITITNGSAYYDYSDSSFSFTCNVNLESIERATITEISKHIQQQIIKMGKKMRII